MELDKDVQLDAIEVDGLEVGVSFKEKLLGNPGSSKSNSSFIEFNLHEQDVKMGVEDDMPTIIFFSKELKGSWPVR